MRCFWRDERKREGWREVRQRGRVREREREQQNRQTGCVWPPNCLQSLKAWEQIQFLWPLVIKYRHPVSQPISLRIPHSGILTYYQGRERGTERAVPRCLESRIRDSGCGNVDKEREERLLRKQVSCLHEFGERWCRRHINIPHSLPWLDNTAAKGKVLFSSGFREQRKAGGLAQVVSPRLGTEAERTGKGSHPG